MSSDKTWPEWTDHLGQTYRPGDWVAVAVINGRSPQLVIAEVERINRRRSSGELITERRHIKDEEGRHTYTFEDVPSCTIRAKPLIDGRGFYRSAERWVWNAESGEGHHEPTPVRSVTYQFPGNIVKVPKPEAQ